VEEAALRASPETRRLQLLRVAVRCMGLAKCVEVVARTGDVAGAVATSPLPPQRRVSAWDPRLFPLLPYIRPHFS
jgi:hypothetical protein